MGLGSWSAAAKRPFATARKAFLSPWTGCKNGEGCCERMKEKEREWRALLSWSVSFETFDVRHGVLVERGFSFLCATVVFIVLREFSMR